LKGSSFQPIYPITEKLRARYIDSKQIAKLEQELIRQAEPHIRETLPESLLKQEKLLGQKRGD